MSSSLNLLKHDSLSVFTFSFIKIRFSSLKMQLFLYPCALGHHENTFQPTHLSQAKQFLDTTHKSTNLLHKMLYINVLNCLNVLLIHSDFLFKSSKRNIHKITKVWLEPVEVFTVMYIFLAPLPRQKVLQGRKVRD